MDTRTDKRFGERWASGALALLVTCWVTLPAGAHHEPGHTGTSLTDRLIDASADRFRGPEGHPADQPFFFSPLILPTDISSWGGQHGHTLGFPHMQGPPDLAAWLFHGQAPKVERDQRYSFTGVWTYLGNVDKYAARIQEKMPALQRVTGELKTPCGDLSPSMPPVPELPSPEKVGKAVTPPAVVGVKDLWSPIYSGPTKQSGNNVLAHDGSLSFLRSGQGFSSGDADKGKRLVVGTPGTTMLAKAANVLALKVGRAYVYNGSKTADLEVESGRMTVILPPGASGIADAAANGLTQYVSLREPAGRATRVVDLCNPAVELAQMQAGKFVTVAPEDAVVEDLVSLYGLSESVDKVLRPEGYLLVTGNFSIGDAVGKEATLQSALFQSDPVLKDQMDQLLAQSKAAPAAGKPLEAGVTATEMAEPTAAAGKGAAFMPTRGARYGTLSRNELMIADGAVLVKGADDPIIVSAEVNRQKVMTSIKSGAVVMVSAVDGRLTILNLTEKALDSCVIYMPGPGGARHKTITVGNGQVAELYIDDGMEPPSTVLAFRVIDKKKLEGGVGLLLAKYDYLAAMKRFNLNFALPAPDLNKVLKTMAATAYMKYGEANPAR